MNRILSSQLDLVNNLDISTTKTIQTNPLQMIRGKNLMDINIEIKNQIWSAKSKLIVAQNILPLINSIDFKNNSIEVNSPGISLFNSGANFDIELKITGIDNHTIISLWLLDTFITSVISSVDICSLMVGNLFNLPERTLYPSSIKEYFNGINSRRKISQLFNKHNPPISNPTNHLSAGRKIWGNIKHGGLQNIIEIKHPTPDMGQSWEAYIKPDFCSFLSPAERKIDIFCDDLLEEGIVFINSINTHLGNRLRSELLPLVLVP